MQGTLETVLLKIILLIRHRAEDNTTVARLLPQDREVRHQEVLEEEDR